MRAICAGAQGYLLKTAPVSEIALAIDDVLDGGSPMNSRIARRVLELFSRLVPPRMDYGLRYCSSWWRGGSRRRLRRWWG